MKQLLLPILALALLAFPAARTRADEAEASKPVAVLAFASYDRLMSDLAFMGNLTGNPDLDKNIEGMIQLFTQGQGFAGLDRTRPLGFTLATDGLQFQPLVVLPVDDLSALLGALEGLVGAAQDAGDDIFELDVFNQKIYVKQKGAWAYLTTAPEPLATLPKDGADIFGDMAKSYDIAGRLYVQNVPEVFRTMLVDQIRVGVDVGLARQEGETDEAYTARRRVVEEQFDALSTSINDMELLTLGLSVNQDAMTAQVELAIKAVAGTETAKQMSQSKSSTSSFAGFLQNDSAASVSICSELTEGDVTQYVAGLNKLREQVLGHIDGESKLPSEDAKKLAKEMATEVFNAIQTTFETGKIDAAATLNTGDKSMALVVGAFVADTAPLNEALLKFAKLAETEPNFPAITLNAVEHNGVKFHTTSIPVPAEHKIAKIVGDKLDVAVGIGEKAVYLVLGNDSIDLAKKVIDASASQTGQMLPPFQVNVALEQIFRFAAAQQDGDTSSLKAWADDLAKVPGKDHLRLEFVPQEDGGAIRLSAEEGVLQLLGSALKNVQASGAIPGF